jgi:hypothetical protein
MVLDRTDGNSRYYHFFKTGDLTSSTMPWFLVPTKGGRGKSGERRGEKETQGSERERKRGLYVSVDGR